MSSPIFPPASGPRRPGNEKRNLFFLCDFFSMSVPWCLRTVLERVRDVEEFDGVCERMLREIESFFSLLRSSSASVTGFFEARTMAPVGFGSVGVVEETGAV